MTEKKVQDLLREISSSLTKSEQKVANVILENYPLSGMEGITILAQKAGVSTPTITRLVDKLGFGGFSKFQRTLKLELDDRLSREVFGGEPWSNNVADAHALNRITESVMRNVRETLETIDGASFDLMCGLIGDADRKVYIVGGWITSSIAEHFYKHLQALRPRTVFLNNSKNNWQFNMIDMEEGDVLLVYDVHRYESELMNIAESAKKLGAEIILVTDTMQSPISKFSTYNINASILMPNGRSSLVCHLLFNELMVFQLQSMFGDSIKQRWQDLEAIFQSTEFYNK